MSDIQDKIKEQVTQNRVVLYMKGTPQFPQCGFSATVAEVQAVLDKSRRRIDQTGGIPHEQFWREVQAESYRRARKAEPRRSRAKRRD